MIDPLDHLDLPRRAAMTLARPGHDVEEVEAECALALVEATRDHEPSKLDFRDHAYRRMETRIRNMAVRDCWLRMDKALYWSTKKVGHSPEVERFGPDAIAAARTALGLRRLSSDLLLKILSPERAEASEAARHVDDLLARVAPREAEALSLRLAFEGGEERPYSQVDSLMGLSEGYSKKLCYAGLKRLRGHLEARVKP